MALDFIKFVRGILIKNEVDLSKQAKIIVDASAATNTSTTLIAAQSTDQSLLLPDSGGADTIVARNTTDTLVNKSMDGNVNTFTNIPGSAITGSINATLVAPGTVSNTEFGYLDGVTSAIQTQIDGKQATGTYITSLTGDVTGTGPGATSTTISTSAITTTKINNNAVTNIKLDQAPTLTIKGNNTGVTANIADLTVSQVNTMLGTLSNPMTTGGDIIYGGASGTPARLANGTSGQYLKSTGGTSAPAWQSLSPPTIQKFASGSGTYTTPAGVIAIRVRAIGGGGGGGGSGTGASAGNGSNGGNTTFGTSLIDANGGGAGLVNVGGTGGTTSLGSPAIGTPMTGNSGDYGIAIGVSFGITGGGKGAPGVFGGGPANPGGAAGSSATSGSGAGGSGGGLSVAGNCGGGGGSGGFVDAIIPSPSATYAYAVGANGTGGTAGTSGAAGGNGGSGYIEVTEFYQ